MNKIITSVQKFGLIIFTLFTASAIGTTVSADTTFDKIKKQVKLLLELKPPFRHLSSYRMARLLVMERTFLIS